MTITNQITKDRYNGDGLTVDFPIPFQFQDVTTDDDQIVVYLRDETDPDNITETLLVKTTDYTLTGGTTAQPVYVHLLSTPTVTQFPVIDRVTNRTQETDYIDGDNFPAESHESALDKLTQIAQELYGFLSRTVLLPITSTLSDLTYAEPIVYGHLRWNSTATELENPALVATVPLLYNPITATFSMPVASASADGYMSSTTYNLIFSDLATLAAAGAAYVVYGTYGAAQAITAGGGISASADQRQQRYVVGSGGAVDVSANPQIAAGSIDGQEMRVIGTDDTNTVLLEHGTGLILNGSCTLRAGATIDLSWSTGASAWIETGRNGV